MRGLKYEIDAVALRDAHPNTAVIELTGADGKQLVMQASSIGGGRIVVNKLDGIDVNFTGNFNTLVIRNQDENGAVVPKIKISENPSKITIPHFKKVYRLYNKENGKAIADYMTVYDEVVDDSKDIEIFDPEATWKTKTVYNYTAKELQVPIFRNGELVYQLPTLEEIRTYCLEQVDTLWDEVKRFDYPHKYYVDLSDKLWDIQQCLLRTSQL